MSSERYDNKDFDNKHFNHMFTTKVNVKNINKFYFIYFLSHFNPGLVPMAMDYERNYVKIMINLINYDTCV